MSPAGRPSDNLSDMDAGKYEIVFAERGAISDGQRWLRTEDVLNEAMKQGGVLVSVVPWRGAGSDGLVFIIRRG